MAEPLIPGPDPADRVTGALSGGIPRWALVVLSLAGVAILFFVVRPLIFPTYFIPSQAMSPTIVEGDRVIGNTFSTNPDRGDVVVFDPPASLPTDASKLIKRVIGLSGETIEIRDGAVFVDGQLLAEPYLAEANSTRHRPVPMPNCDEGSAADRCVIPEGHVFVMGDNRVNSADSRVHGPIPIDSISSKVFMKILPFSRI